MPRSFEAGRRLCLLLEAGGVRYAVEATAVVEVAPPDPRNDRVRGMFELKDLSVLMGGPPEERPGMGVVLDVSPTLAVRVRRVFEVVDVARAPLFHLPRGLAPALGAVVSGALLFEDRVHLELLPDALAAAPAPARAPERPPLLMSAPPERALVFESGGRRFGVPLGFVFQVVACGPSFSPLPGRDGPAAGLFPHAQSLWPIYSVPAVLGGQAGREELLVLTDLGGEHVGWTASRVVGVLEGFGATDAPGEYAPRGLAGPAVTFLDLQRMFS